MDNIKEKITTELSFSFIRECTFYSMLDKGLEPSEKFYKSIHITEFPKDKDIEEIAERLRLEVISELSSLLHLLATKVLKVNISLEKIKELYLDHIKWQPKYCSISVMFSIKKDYNSSVSNILFHIPKEPLLKYLNRERKREAKSNNLNLSDVEILSSSDFIPCFK